MDERRKNDRIDAFDIGLQAINSIDGEALGVIGNLSTGGMMLITTRQLFANGVLQLKIDLPAELGNGPIALGVKILWCVPANSPDEYWAGLETIDISSHDENALVALLERLANIA